MHIIEHAIGDAVVLDLDVLVGPLRVIVAALVLVR